jgi:hypothetical protein
MASGVRGLSVDLTFLWNLVDSFFHPAFRVFDLPPSPSSASTRWGSGEVSLAQDTQREQRRSRAEKSTQHMYNSAWSHRIWQ